MVDLVAITAAATALGVLEVAVGTNQGLNVVDPIIGAVIFVALDRPAAAPHQPRRRWTTPRRWLAAGDVRPIAPAISRLPIVRIVRFAIGFVLGRVRADPAPRALGRPVAQGVGAPHLRDVGPVARRAHRVGGPDLARADRLLCVRRRARWQGDPGLGPRPRSRARRRGRGRSGGRGGGRAPCAAKTRARARGHHARVRARDDPVLPQLELLRLGADRTHRTSQHLRRDPDRLGHRDLLRRARRARHHPGRAVRRAPESHGSSAHRAAGQRARRAGLRAERDATSARRVRDERRHRGGGRLPAVAASAGVRPEPVRPVRQSQRVHDGDRRRRRVACRRGARRAVLPRHAVVPPDRVAGAGQRHRCAADPAHHPGRVRRTALPAPRSLAGAGRTKTRGRAPEPDDRRTRGRSRTDRRAGRRRRGEALAQPPDRQRTGARARGPVHRQRPRRGRPRRLRRRPPRHPQRLRPRPDGRPHAHRDRLAGRTGIAGADRGARRSHEPRPAHVDRRARLGVLHPDDRARLDARAAGDRPIGCRHRQGGARPDAQLVAGRLLRHRRQAASFLVPPSRQRGRCVSRADLRRLRRPRVRLAGAVRPSRHPGFHRRPLRAQDARADPRRVRAEGDGCVGGSGAHRRTASVVRRVVADRLEDREPAPDLVLPAVPGRVADRLRVARLAAVRPSVRPRRASTRARHRGHRAGADRRLDRRRAGTRPS